MTTKLCQIATLLLCCVAAPCHSAITDTAQQRLTAPPLPPSAHDTVVAIGKLRTTLDGILKTYQNGRHRQSAYFVSLQTGRVFYEHKAQQTLTPASTTKLFSTAAALHLFGPTGVITTDVYVDGTVDAGGILKGSLYLVGHGDPMLSVADLEYIADLVAKAGISNITGDIIADATYFDAEYSRAKYSGDNEDVQAMPAVSALGVNNNTVTVVVTRSHSGRISTQAIPNGDCFVFGDIPTNAKEQALPSVNKKPSLKAPRKKPSVSKKRLRTKARAALESHYEQRAGDTAPALRRRRQAPASIRSRTTADGVQHFTVGSLPPRNRSISATVPMANPPVATAGIFAVRLRAGGIDIRGQVRAGRRPATARRIASLQRPLTDIVDIVNKRSDNYYAEHLFKIVGANCGGSTNTAEHARAALLDIMDSLALTGMGCLLNDGSGLSRRNLASAYAEAELLRAIWQQEYGAAFHRSLSIAGVDGTLRRRMTGTAAAHNVRAKTGTLRNVSALSGFITTADGETLAFAILSNGPSPGSYKAAENRVMEEVSRFTYRSPP